MNVLPAYSQGVHWSRSERYIRKPLNRDLLDRYLGNLDPRWGLGYHNHGTHIRGRVFTLERLRDGSFCWAYEVINTHTGKVIASDNTADFTQISFLAHQAVAVCRGAWNHELRWKDLK